MALAAIAGGGLGLVLAEATTRQRQPPVRSTAAPPTTAAVTSPAAPTTRVLSPSTTTSAPARRSLTGTTIVIDPGHNGDNASHAAQIGRSHRLALAVRDGYGAGTGMPRSTYAGHDGLDDRSDLGGLNLSAVPKVFIECGNLRNPADAVQLESSAFRQRAAEALAAGISRFTSGR